MKARYTISWDDQPSVDAGWVTSKIEYDEDGPVLGGRDDEPLDCVDEDDVDAAIKEAAEHWGVPPERIERDW